MPKSSSKNSKKACKSALRFQKALNRVWEQTIDDALEAVRTQTETAKIVHRLRVTGKRLRGLLQMLRPSLDPKVWRREDVALRDLNRKLAELRTATVMEHTRDRMASSNGAFSVPKLPHEVALEEVPIEQVIRELQAKRELMADLIPSKAGPEILEKGLRTTYRLGRRNFRRWQKEGELATAHECRKYAKYLLFQIELCKDLGVKRLGKLHSRLSKLEGQLGKLNDLADFEELQTGLRSAYLVKEKQWELGERAQKTARRIFKRKPREFARKRLRKWKP